MNSRKPLSIGEVFISHSSRDRKSADMIAAALRDQKVPFWYSTTNIIGAQQWHDEIGQALARCNWFLLILTPSSVKSGWVKHELLYALNHSQYEKRIIPCLIRDCDITQLSWTLSSFQNVDFRSDMEQGLAQLFRVWGMTITHPSPRTSSPKSKTGKSRSRREK